MPTLADLIESKHNDKTAVIVPGGGPQLTFAELQTQITSLAGVIQAAELQPGDAASLVFPNGLDYIATFLAITRARAIAAPLNPAYTVDEFLFYMEDAESKVVILPPGDHPAIEAAAKLNIPVWRVTLDESGEVHLDTGADSTEVDAIRNPEESDVALFLHTSGTTSRPKGVPLTHGNLMASLGNIVGTYQLSPDDTSMVVMPQFHVHGLMGSTLSTLKSGGTVIVPPRFSASTFWRDVTEHDATWYSAVPTIHQILLSRAENDNAPRGTFRLIRSCSAAMAPIILKRMEERFEAPVLEAYAMTEASHQMSSNPLPPDEHRPGSVGRGTGVEITILDDDGNELPQGGLGEVSIKGPNVTHGYHKNPEANAAAFTNGWFRTGDQGFFDEDGFLTLAGRIKELINRGGEKISPLEIDAILLEHPAVSEAVCFAVPDELYGEEVEAAIVLQADATGEILIEFCKQRLVDFKVPKQIYFATELPRTATGKIQRRHVAAHFRDSV